MGSNTPVVATGWLHRWYQLWPVVLVPWWSWPTATSPAVAGAPVHPHLVNYGCRLAVRDPVDVCPGRCQESVLFINREGSAIEKGGTFVGTSPCFGVGPYGPAEGQWSRTPPMRAHSRLALTFAGRGNLRCTG